MFDTENRIIALFRTILGLEPRTEATARRERQDLLKGY